MSMFSHDTDLAYFMLSSGLLNQACNAICDMRVSVDDQDSPFTVTFDVFETPDYKILVFRSSLECTSEYLEEKGEEVTPLNTKFFKFANQKVNPAISINKTAADAFDSLFEGELYKLQDENITAKQLLVTGNALGGSVASLFTLYLLDSVYKTTSKRPICITFGSPPLGNDGLRKAIYQQASWPTCFIHVALSQDPIPKLFGSPNYEPFGSFIFCSASGCACIGQLESVREIMVALKHVEDLDLSGFQIDRYRHDLVKLKNEGMPHLGDLHTKSLELGISLDLQAIGVLQVAEVNNDTRSLIRKIETRKVKCINLKRNEFDKKRKLNDSKISMAYHEWYKKRTVADGGYYDSYKAPAGADKIISRERIKREKGKLQKYWEDVVGEANQTPQNDALSLRTAWLFASAVYRRMCEPLHIADHYLSGKTDYINTRP